MTTNRSTKATAGWAVLALAGGFLTDWASGGASEVQGTVLILMLVTFALTLPGSAPVLLVAISSVAPFLVLEFFRHHDVVPAYAILIVPALIGAGGGRLAGKLLDTASSRLGKSELDGENDWTTRPLSKRFVLAVGLVVIAVSGLPAVSTRLRTLQHPAAGWLALVWQIMTLLGWIGLTPFILSISKPGDNGLAPKIAMRHAATIGALVIVHALAVVTISGALFIPLVPSWNALVVAAVLTYLPLDLLAYVTILTLGYISDVERRRQSSAQREAVLRAESVDSRMAALRARLNPHFLFNALNSVDVLARAGKTSEMSKVLEGLTGLLRYVLDERRAVVPLHEELEFVRSYFELQHVRFGDRLRYAIVAQPGVEHAGVPQLLVQPIAENAVEHGVTQTLDGGVVRVDAKRDGDMVELSVEDDGVGIGDERSTAGVGLSSTRERLERLFGNRATLSVASRPGGRGTRAVIRIPYQALDTK
jgi:two-component system LytT family sensor kinase